MTATWVATLSWIIPLLEISVALLLVWPRLQKIALYMSIAILGGYVIYSGSILYIAPYIPCSCGGMFKFLSWQQQLGLSIVFLVIAIGTLYLSNTLKKI
ncbi:hypothetical protein DNG35_11990 [Mesonia sp. K7]|nr:hypothetical protein DNG35_11990 [Mesonia sp. K7]